MQSFAGPGFFRGSFTLSKAVSISPDFKFKSASTKSCHIFSTKVTRQPPVPKLDPKDSC